MRWTATRIARLIEANRALPSVPEQASDVPVELDMSSGDSAAASLLDRLCWADHREFVEQAYRVILGRPPDADEYVQTLTGLQSGDAKTWLLGCLRYGAEGRTRGIDIPGLRTRYLAQKLFRIRGIGPLFEWMNAILRLPASLRSFRAITQMGAGSQFDTEQVVRGMAAELSTARVASTDADTGAAERFSDLLGEEIEELRSEIAALRAEGDAMRSRLDAIFPPALGDSLEVAGAPLITRVRQALAVPDPLATSELSSSARYALFEAAFYDSQIVAAKQRIYLPYIDLDLARRYRFIDLGCGRGEFLRALAEQGVRGVGVDANAVSLQSADTAGIDAVERDLLEYLSASRETFCGAAALQVAEHLTAAQVEQLLSLVAARLAPGAPLIVETPNPLCPFALARFHTDPTHVAPIPPERLRFAVEAAGFERALTLFQAPVPGRPFFGPDPQAYFMDYAIIAYRSPP